MALRPVGRGHGPLTDSASHRPRPPLPRAVVLTLSRENGPEPSEPDSCTVVARLRLAEPPAAPDGAPLDDAVLQELAQVVHDLHADMLLVAGQVRDRHLRLLTDRLGLPALRCCPHPA